MNPLVTSSAGIRDREALDCVVERAIVRLNTMCRTATLSFAIATGRTVIDEFYGGDVSKWRSRDPHKDLPLRRLSQHPDLPMSPAALYRSIAIFELTDRLKLSAWKHICTSHLRLVLPCAPEQQERLLYEAEANRSTVDHLNRQVAQVLSAQSSRPRGGRRRASTRRRAAVALERQLHELVSSIEVAATDDDASPESTRTIVDTLERAAETCLHLASRLRIAASEGGCADPHPRNGLHDDVTQMSLLRTQPSD